MSFGWPPMLAALLLIPLGMLVLRAIDHRRRRALAAAGGLGLRPARGPGDAQGGIGARARERVPPLLILLGFVVLIVALARPQAAVALPSVEGTIVLTFNVSGSMAADDVEPTRLEAAKAVARDFVQRQPPGVVIGVVAFSDAGLSVQTPTSDTATVLTAIARLGPTLGTSLGEGVLAALELIDRAESGTPAEYYSSRTPAPRPSLAPVPPGSHTSAAIVLLSDGENTAAPDPPTVARTAADRGIAIHMVGVGSAAGTTIEIDGFLVHTQLDEAMLRDVADITGGTYHGLADAERLDDVYDALGRRVVLRSESLELTAPLAALGTLLLVCGAVASLASSGRLP